MMNNSPLHLFQGIGIELEYMIVDRKTLGVRPIAHELLREVSGGWQTEYEQEDICWSNELALHLIELKTCGPASDLSGTVSLFQRDIRRLGAILHRHGAMLMPTGAHPWMDPYRETRLWPLEYNLIYETYDRIFNCRGHGWANLQSAHINLPFSGDEEFGRLHAAIRVLLPIIPALTASTPIMDLEIQPNLDHRLEVYRTNSQRIPSITGRVIPEQVFTQAEYRRQILGPMYREIAPLDPEGVLQHEWLNARGAIARFSRSAIEIRILDVQECPLADLAIASLIFHTLRILVSEKWSSYQEQCRWGVEPLADIYQQTVKQAQEALLANPSYARLFAMDTGKPTTAGTLWRHIFMELEKVAALEPVFRQPLSIVLGQGSLASRIMSGIGVFSSRAEIAEVYRSLCRCLAEGRLYQVEALAEAARARQAGLV